MQIFTAPRILMFDAVLQQTVLTGDTLNCMFNRHCICLQPQNCSRRRVCKRPIHWHWVQKGKFNLSRISPKHSSGKIENDIANHLMLNIFQIRPWNNAKILAERNVKQWKQQMKSSRGRLLLFSAYVVETVCLSWIFFLAVLILSCKEAITVLGIKC